MEKQLEGKRGENAWEFFRRMMGEESYFKKIQVNWSIHVPVVVARSMGLEGRTLCKCEEAGNTLVMTPLRETGIAMKIQLSSTSSKYPSLIVGIPADMLFIAGLKVGDYAAWSEKEGLLCLRKVEKDAPYARKIQRISGGSFSVGITIPKEMAEKAHVEPGGYGFWTFKDLNKSLWLEVGGTRNITSIMKVEVDYGATFRVSIPEGMRGMFEIGDEVVLRVKEGKIYVTK